MIQNIRANYYAKIDGCVETVHYFLARKLIPFLLRHIAGLARFFAANSKALIST